jgi:hypothetical protein
MSDPFVLLRIERDACARLDYELTNRREARDQLALQLVEAGHTWREVGEAAGLEQKRLRRNVRRAMESEAMHPDKETEGSLPDA